MKVAVIGLGTMGMGAALNLVRKGHQVTGCDVREAARAELAAAGGAAVAGAAEVPADTEAVVVFVVNAAQTEDVLFGAQGCLPRLAKGRGGAVLRHRRARGGARAGGEDRRGRFPDARCAGVRRQGRRAWPAR